MTTRAPFPRGRATVVRGALVLVLLLGAALVPPSSTPVALGASVSPPVACPAGSEWQLRDLVNQFRAAHGKPALRLSAELTRKAQAWSDHLAAVRALSHSVLTDGVSAGYSLLGENVAYASDGLAAAQTGLEHSPPHYRNLVGDYTEIGLGVSVDSNGYTYVVQVFARRAVPTAAYGGPPGSSVFTPVPPYTVFRPKAAVPGGTISAVKVTGIGGVPAGASSVMTVLEAVNATGPGWFQLMGPGAVRGSVAGLDVDRGRGSVTSVTAVASDGTIRLTGSVTANVRLTVVGFFTPTASQARGGRFVPVPTGRLLDTRPTSRVAWTGGRPGAGTVATVRVLGRGGLPTSGVRAVALDVVSIGPDGPGALQVGKPGMAAGGWDSALLPRAGQNRSSLVVTPVDSAGNVAVRTSVGTYLVVEVRGWFTGSSAPLSGRGLFVPIAPARFLDTRTAGAATSGIHTTRTASRLGVPACPAAVLGSVTLLPGAPTTAQVGPAGGFRAGAWSSVIGSVAGLPVKNTFLSAAAGHGGLGVFTPGAAQVVVDLSGWFV